MAQCSAEQKENQADDEQAQIRHRMSRIKHKILVLSGKGGVGKSTVAVNLAVSLALQGKKVGLLDIDIHGPSIPKILNLESKKPVSLAEMIQPIPVMDNLSAMSVGFFLHDQDSPVIWRGPMKYQMIKQFLKDVEWADLDYLVVDAPPGTGDEPLAVVQLIGDADGAVVVTTPQQVAVTDVRKCISFCRQLNLPVLGVIENMSGFVCPECGYTVNIFKAGGGENMAMEMNVAFLGRIPLDPRIVEACDAGQPYVSTCKTSVAARSFTKAIKPILELDTIKNQETTHFQKGNQTMRFAIPLHSGKLCQHFGHCDVFALVDTNGDGGKIVGRKDVTPPPHEPGVLPKWLHEQGVNVILAGGMGQRAQQLFAQKSIKVLVGVPVETPENLVTAYHSQTLQTGVNTCDH